LSSPGAPETKIVAGQKSAKESIVSNHIQKRDGVNQVMYNQKEIWHLHEKVMGRNRNYSKAKTAFLLPYI
jgi:hypothetical protein